jgi:hypothetical protein
MTTITVPTRLLAAVTKWAHRDAERPTGCVAFRPGTPGTGSIVATDGYRLVVVPWLIPGDRPFGVERAHLLAAIAAQDSYDDDECSFGPDGERRIDIGPNASVVDVIIIKHSAAKHNVVVRVPLRVLDKYPAIDQVFRPVSNHEQTPTPDGYLLDARFLAAVEEVNTASLRWSTAAKNGVRVVQWGRVDPDGSRPAVILQNIHGVKFAIMPLREP